MEAEVQDRGDGLVVALRALAAQVGVEAGEETVQEAARRAAGASSWEDALAAGLAPLGLRARFVRGTLDEVAARARPDLPMVTSADGAGGGWVVARGTWFGTPVLEGAAPPHPGRPARWARVEPVLPASPLSPPGPGRPSPVRRLLGLLAAERSDIGVVVIFALGAGLLGLATPLAIQALVQWMAFGALTQPLFGLAVALLACLLVAAGLRSAQRHVVEVLQRRLFVRTVADLSARLARVRVESLDGVHAPELVNRFFDVLTLQKAIATLLLDGLGAALQAMVGLVLLAAYHPVLLGFDVVVVGLAALVLLPFARAGQDSAVKESKYKYEVAAWLEEVARRPLLFKTGGHPLAEDHADRLVRAWLGARTRHFAVFFRQFVGMQLLQVVVGVGLLLTGGWLVVEGQLTLGQLVAAEFVVTAALAGLAKFTDKLESVYDLLAGVDKLGTLVDLPHDGTVGLPGGPGPGVSLEASGLVVVRDGREVLRDVAFSLPAGGSLGIVSDPGPDRDALVEVLVGARAPRGGKLTRDGLPAAARRPDQVLGEALLLRADGLFRGTVRENLALGRPEPDARTWSALAALGLADAVAALPNGLDTPLGEGGTPLGPHQARALVLARALLHDRARLVVVDGLLDGVPASLAERWLSAVGPSLSGRTRILTTDDPAVAARADHRLSFVDGGLRELAV